MEGEDLSDSKKKYYAIVPLNGKSQVLFKAWKDVEGLIVGVSLFAQHGFETQVEADVWILTKEKERAASVNKKKTNQLVKNRLAKNEFTKTQIIASQTNTRYWNEMRKLKKRISET
jgi:hypothetical protein